MQVVVALIHIKKFQSRHTAGFFVLKVVSDSTNKQHVKLYSLCFCLYIVFLSVK